MPLILRTVPTLGEVHLPDSELPALPGNDYRKAAIARRLHMRSPGNVSQQPSRLRKISVSSQN